MALYGLDEVERVEALEAERRAIADGFITNAALDGKALERREREYFAMLRRGAKPAELGLPIEHYADFPGFPGYKRKPPVS